MLFIEPRNTRAGQLSELYHPMEEVPRLYSNHTNYFFDIKNSAFKEGLDRFAHFFINPLLSDEYVDREKNAVHSEYQMQKKEDSWRQFMTSKLAMNPEYAGSKFSIGSLDTLSGDVKEELKSFQMEQYSADQMGVVVLSNESIAGCGTGSNR